MTSGNQKSTPRENDAEKNAEETLTLEQHARAWMDGWMDKSIYLFVNHP